MSLQETDAIAAAGAGIEIRDYDARRDREGVIRCVAALQDYERSLEPTLPPGDRIARRYVEAMLQRCAAYEGRVFVAAGSSALVGFVCVLARVPETAPDEYARPHAAIGELFVDESFRGAGVGRRLLARAETHARVRGAERLRVQVLAANDGARELYRGFGFRDRLVELEKRLESRPSKRS
ncbi:MAG: GNAT family N-acetyltransferase [Pseudomonadales bacterium]|nr:GNAT family N-acetyltransferase [Pseudomonadales bacterium]